MAARERSPLRCQIGDRLRALRTEAGISSQEKLAELAGVDRTYIGRLERGESGVTIESLAAIVGAMSVSLGRFFQPFRRPLKLRTPRRRE